MQRIAMTSLGLIAAVAASWSSVPVVVPAASLDAAGAACNCDSSDTMNCRDIFVVGGGQACSGGHTFPVQDVHEVDDLEHRDSGGKDCDDPDCGMALQNWEWYDDC